MRHSQREPSRPATTLALLIVLALTLPAVFVSSLADRDASAAAVVEPSAQAVALKLLEAESVVPPDVNFREGIPTSVAARVPVPEPQARDAVASARSSTTTCSLDVDSVGLRRLNAISTRSQRRVPVGRPRALLRRPALRR